MNLGADVLAPFLDIAARLPVNGGADKGLDIAGQNDFPRPAALLRRDKRDGWNRLVVGPLFELLAVVPTAGYSSISDRDRHHGQEQNRAADLHRGAIFRVGFRTLGVSVLVLLAHIGFASM